MLCMRRHAWLADAPLGMRMLHGGCAHQAASQQGLAVLSSPLLDMTRYESRTRSHQPCCRNNNVATWSLEQCPPAIACVPPPPWTAGPSVLAAASLGGEGALGPSFPCL